MFKDNISSWIWPRYEGKPAVLAVSYEKAKKREVIRAGEESGSIKVAFKAEGCEEQSLEIYVKS